MAMLLATIYLLHRHLDRDGKFQLLAITDSAFDPLAD